MQNLKTTIEKAKLALNELKIRLEYLGKMDEQLHHTELIGLTQIFISMLERQISEAEYLTTADGSYESREYYAQQDAKRDLIEQLLTWS